MSQYILSELFPTLADLFEHVPGIDANLTFKELNATAISSRKIICDIVSPVIWDQVRIESDTPSLLYLRSAYANLVMYNYKIFAVVQARHNSDNDTYKNELETMRRQYIDNYHNAMDSLLQILIDSPVYNWADTPYAQQLHKLQIKTVADFQTYYHIDTSFLFFIRTIPIQRKELLQTFRAYYDKISERPDLLDHANFALVYTIIARALQQFDLIEFPATIRNYFDDNKLSRNGKDERNALSAMVANLLNEATDFLNNIDLALQGDAETDISVGNPDNRPDNKYYFPG